MQKKLSLIETNKLNRLIRDNNLLKMEMKEMIKRETEVDKELCYLIQREKVLTSLEKSLPKRIEAYEEAKAPKVVVLELNKIYELLMAQKSSLKESMNE